MTEREQEGRSLLFGPDGVRAVLAGAKTATRRVMKQAAWTRAQLIAHAGRVRRSPFGERGSTLWVRETWAAVDAMTAGYEREEPVDIAYRATMTAISSTM